MRLIIIWNILLAAMLAGCANINTTPPADNPMDGTAQQADPSVFEHRT